MAKRNLFFLSHYKQKKKNTYTQAAMHLGRVPCLNPMNALASDVSLNLEFSWASTVSVSGREQVAHVYGQAYKIRCKEFTFI